MNDKCIKITDMSEILKNKEVDTTGYKSRINQISSSNNKIENIQLNESQTQKLFYFPST